MAFAFNAPHAVWSIHADLLLIEFIRLFRSLSEEKLHNLLWFIAKIWKSIRQNRNEIRTRGSPGSIKINFVIYFFLSLVLLLNEIDSVAWCVCVRNRILNVSSVDWNTKNILFSFECRVRSLLHCSVECVYVHRVCAENKIRSRLLVDARVTFVATKATDKRKTNPFTGATASKQKPNGMKMELQSVSRMRQSETEKLPEHDKSKSNTHLKRT